MTNFTARLALLSSVSTASAIFLIPIQTMAQSTTCSQATTNITCVDGTATVLTATTTPTTTTVPGPGLRTVNTTGPSTISYVATGPIATTAVPAINLTSTGGALSFTPSGTTAPVNVMTTGGASADGVLLNTAGQAATVTVGNISTTGTSSFGVRSNGGTDLTLRTGDITTTGATSRGIQASAQTGALNITAGNITTTDRGLSAAAGANSDAVVVTGNIIAGASGALVNGNNVNITTGNVSAANGFGVIGQAIGATGSVFIRTGTVTNTGNSGVGGSAFNAVGSVDVGGCSSVTTRSVNNAAVFAQNGGTGSLTINCGAVSNVGNNAVFALSDGTPNGGNIAITTTSAAASNTQFSTIFAQTRGTGTITVNAGTVTGGANTAGVGGTGVDLNGGTGAVDAGYGNVSTIGTALRSVSTGTLNLRGAGATLTTSGAGATGAILTANGVTGNLGNVTTTGLGSQGAIITSTAPVTLTVGNVATTGNGLTVNAGANAVTLTTGTVTATEAGATGTVINSTGAVTFSGGKQTANGANALQINGGAGAINASVVGAATTGTGTAVAINGTGPLTFANSGSITTTGASSTGLSITGVTTAVVNCGNIVTTGANSPAVAVAANGTTNVTCGIVRTSGSTSDAITVSNTAGSTTVTGAITSATGAGSRGIVVTSSAPANGLVTVNTGLVTANGNAVTATSAGTSGVALNANSNITSTTGAGVTVTTAGGPATVTQDAASTITAATDAIKVNNSVGGAINVNALGTLIANNGSGVFVNTNAASADPINVTTNIIRSTGGAGTWGSQVRASAGTGDITITSNGAIGSAGAPGSIFGGILAATSGTSNRNVTVNVNADIGSPTDGSAAAQVLISVTSTSAKTLAVNIANASIYGGPAAIQVTQNATSLGDIRIIGTGSGTLSANGPTGIGISARILNAANPGMILVDVTQNVTAILQGINATTLGVGNVSVVARGNVTSANDTGINAVTGGTTQVTIGAGTTTTGVQGVNLQGSAGNILIVNGTLRNTGGTTPYTVLAGGPFILTVGSAGRIVGPLAFTTGNDTFNNMGTFALPTTLDFLSGNDVLNNSGTLTSFAGPVTLSNLETLNNSGVIDMRNGVTGNIITVSGNYVGSGAATLGIDVGAGAAIDKLVIGGSATGSTAVLINGINGQFVNSAVIVDAGAGSSASAFSLAPSVSGLVAYSLAFVPTANDYVLRGVPTASAIAPLQMVGGARELFYKGNDLIGAHLSDFGGWSDESAERPGASLWIAMQGSKRTAGGNYAANVFGTPLTYDLTTEQDFFNVQGGVDFGAGTSAVIGLTGGAGTSELHVPNGAGRFNYRALNVGAYGRFNAGLIFGSALVRYEHYNITASSQAAGYSARTNGHAWGGRGELGLHFGSAAYFVEPLVSVDYARLRMDGYSAFNTSFGFNNPDGLRGKAGARVGALLSDKGARISAYGRAMAVHEFRADDTLTLSNTGGTLLLAGNRQRTYGEGALGLEIASPGGIHGFMEGTGEFSGGVRGYGARAGLSVRF